MWSSCRRWGQFPLVKPRRHRLYVRAYWRFLLDWEYPPLRTDVAPEVGRVLRIMAKDEVLAYRGLAHKQGGAVVLAFQPPPPSPSPMVTLVAA